MVDVVVVVVVTIVKFESSRYAKFPTESLAQQRRRYSPGVNVEVLKDIL